ncbi:MAG: EAL domain-containing protein, partial [Phycisphaerales bacterium]|nr:EAL domain-containing protein [Phycisphaerales bacterium]
YQPKALAAEGRIVGTEALVRWRHPELGVVFPDEFIPIAERSGIINELTSYVLRTAVAEATHWSGLGRRWGVSVNLSMRNLLDRDLTESVRQVLAESGLDPASLTLEITETNVMSDAARSIEILDGLAALGVRLSIDDFGTGYSSLAYLQQLPVHEVKIDKSFVMPMTTNPSSAVLVGSIIDLGHNLGLRVVAEGVEDRTTWNRLTGLGCDVIQGYFVGRPMPPGDLDHWHEELSLSGRLRDGLELHAL